jgi:hypothetical protein
MSFFPAEVRVILLRECEKKGKKLLFDSQSVERQSLKVTAAAKLLRMSFESILLFEQNILKCCFDFNLCLIGTIIFTMITYFAQMKRSIGIVIVINK